MKKKFDALTAKKIISEYADKINFYMKQNQVLKAQLDDMTTTLNINKNILYGQLLDNAQSKDFISVLNQLKAENERVSQKNQELNKEKEILESKLRKMQSDYDEKFLNEKSEYEKLNEEIFSLQQKLYEKESALVNLKRETEKNPNHEIIKEIFIADPTKINVELNNELNYTRDIMAKVSKMLNAEKSKNEKLEKKYKQLSEDFEELKNLNINVALNSDNTGIVNNTCANCCNINLTKDDNNNLNSNNYKHNNFSCLNDNYKRGSYNTLTAGGNNIALSGGLNILNSKSHNIAQRSDATNMNRNAINCDASSNLNTSVNNISRNRSNTENIRQKGELSEEGSNEFLSSDIDSQKSEQGSLELKFPDKVQMEKKGGHNKSNSFIPKLDFSKVQEKYNNENMKKINVINNNKLVKPNNKRDKEESLEAENKNLNKQNEKLRVKLDKYKNGYNDLKEKYKSLKVQYKLCCNKVEFLETQIKRMTNRQSTEDITNKRFEMVENTSMNHNLSDLYDEQDIDDDCSNIKNQEKVDVN